MKRVPCVQFHTMEKGTVFWARGEQWIKCDITFPGNTDVYNAGKCLRVSRNTFTIDEVVWFDPITLLQPVVVFEPEKA